MLRSFAEAGVSALVFLLMGGTMAFELVEAAEPIDGDIHRLETDWARITFRLEDGERRKSELQALADRAAVVAGRYPDRAEPLIWQGIIASSEARYAGAFGVLSAAHRARELLEKAGRIDYRALDGAVPVRLGALYYQVPGFPLGFGDNALARHYLRQGVTISPDGLDSNYFFGDFLWREGEYAEAAAVLRRGLAAPADPLRPVWDAGRREEMRRLLAKVQQRLSMAR